MAFVHGKSTAALFGGYNLSSYFNDASVSESVETAETTAFGQSAKTYITGLVDGTISLSGMFDSATNAVEQVLNSVLGTDTANVATVAPEGLTHAKVAYGCSSRVTSFDVSAPVADVVSLDVEIQATGGIDRAIILNGAQAFTTTANGTTYDSSAGTSNGGVGTIHVTANTSSGACTFKVQHSTDGSTWVDLVTFTNTTATTVSAERVTVAAGTTVNRYLRGICSTYAGGGSVTATITFARR